MPARTTQIATHRWPLREAFTISRSSVTHVDTVIVTIGDGTHQGRGECRPYPRYGETPEGVTAAISALVPALDDGLSRAALQVAMPPGAARNAVDCALWDLEAKQAGSRAWELAGLAPPQPLTTAYTLSLDTPEKMFAAAKRAASRPLLKIKLGGDGDGERMAAVREGAPNAQLIVDANEGWNAENFAANIAACQKAGVVLIEQPLPAGKDAALRDLDRSVPVCADESAHDRASLDHLVGLYDAVNIKLDKTGGLTEALAMAEAAQERGLKIMAGCMVASSLAMAPALLVAQFAEFVDLDGPLLLVEDDASPLSYVASLVQPSPPGLWG